jgi:hypothetical protein
MARSVVVVEDVAAFGLLCIAYNVLTSLYLARRPIAGSVAGMGLF